MLTRSKVAIENDFITRYKLKIEWPFLISIPRQVNFNVFQNDKTWQPYFFAFHHFYFNVIVHILKFREQSL